MSVVAVAVVLGALVLLLLRSNQLRLGSALVAVVFGLVLGSTPAGPAVNQTLAESGTWLWVKVSAL